MHSENTFHLSEEIIEEILSRLGVKPLLRFRCVSKSWCSLIVSQRFIKTQFQNSTINKSLAHHRVIFKYGRAETKQCSLHSLLDEPSIYPSLINIPNPSNTYHVVVGCCNGLVCILNILECRFLLWNPATRISIELPKLDLCMGKYGFGLDYRSGAYKVIGVVYDHEQRIGKVYSTNSNSWKTVEHGEAYAWPNAAGQFVCGKLHWFNRKGQDIESFDLESEEFGRIKLSFDPYNWFDSGLGEIGGRLCVCDHHLKESRLDVWVMEYGMRESWFKLLNVPLVQLKWPIDPSYKIYQLNLKGANGEILLTYGNKLLVYYFKDNEFLAVKTVENSGEFHDAQVYVESLVSPALTRISEQYVESCDSFN